uniref:Zinc transporter ZIP4 n=1 Tax=Monopterus albus TaxID=43700 RepID=A0A3Q3J1D9_MONAL|nr:zinc transporter ZIP4-like [Monopterus albus]
MFSSPLLILSLLAVWGLFGSVSGSPALEEAYRDVVSVVSPGQRVLTGDSLRSLFNTLENRVQCGEVSCEKCVLIDAVDQLISNNSIHSNHGEHGSGGSRENITISESQFTDLAAGCILYLSSPDLVCTAISQGLWREETEHYLHKITQEDHTMDINGIQARLQELHGHYKPAYSESCLRASDMIKVNASTEAQRQEVGAILGLILYHALQGHCFISQSLPEESFFLDYIMGHLGSENSTVGGLKTLMKSLNISNYTEMGHEHGAKHKKRSSLGHQNGSTTWDQSCFLAEELVLIYGLRDNSSASSGLARSDVARLSPALVQQVLSGACMTTTEQQQSDGLTKAQRYLYATLARVLIIMTSMFSIVLLLCTSCTSAFQLVIQFFISLAVGSLTGDASLHLLPMFLGLHAHGVSNQNTTPDHVYKMLVLLGGIYLFYLVETGFYLITLKFNHHHQHDHSEQPDPHHCDPGAVLEMYQQEKQQKDKSQLTSKTDLAGAEDTDESLPEPKECTGEQHLLPYMILIGDAVHNFADGLAIGAAFSLSWKSGLATSVAVLCHELPHELGDFAILLNSGMSVRRALLLSFCSAMTSFISLYITLSVATDLAATHWVAAVTAGLFLYVGLADMMPTMVHINNKRPWLIFLLQNVGLLTGWAIMLVLSLYGERISF